MLSSDVTAAIILLFTEFYYYGAQIINENRREALLPFLTVNIKLYTRILRRLDKASEIRLILRTEKFSFS